MFGFQVGVSEVDALLEGRMEPDEAPLALQEVATLVLAARSLHANGGLAGENSVVAAFVESVRPPLAAVSPVSPRPRRSAGRFSAKVAGTAAVLALGGAAAAAATGSLPGSVQGALSRNLSHIGINVPNPATDAGQSAGAGSNVGHGRSTALAAPTTTANEFGLCTAYSHVSANATSGKALSSVAFSRLETAAAAANGGQGESVQTFCASITKPGTSTGSDGTSSTDSGGKPATTPSGNTPGGPPATTPAGNTPGSSSSNPSGDAPGTTPAGNTPGSPPATTPGGTTSGSQGADQPQTNRGNSSTTPAGTAPGLTQTGAGLSGTQTTN